MSFWFIHGGGGEVEYLSPSVEEREKFRKTCLKTDEVDKL